jgi:hypothetical protein
MHFKVLIQMCFFLKRQVVEYWKVFGNTLEKYLPVESIYSNTLTQIHSRAFNPGICNRLFIEHDLKILLNGSS